MSDGWTLSGHPFLSVDPPALIDLPEVQLRREPPMTVPTELLHDAPCPLSNPRNWVRSMMTDNWSSPQLCTCDIVDTTPATPDEIPIHGVEPEPAVGEPEIPATLPEEFQPAATVAGGWCAPGAQAYALLPEVTVKRGGISFTPGPDFTELLKPLAQMSKKELRAEVERLYSANAKTRSTLQRALAKERKRNRKLRRIITKVLGL